MLNADGLWEIWTRQNDSIGTLNNYLICGSFQFKEEAQQFCTAVNSHHALLEVAQMAASTLQVDRLALMQAARAALAIAKGGTV